MKGWKEGRSNWARLMIEAHAMRHFTFESCPPSPLTPKLFDSEGTLVCGIQRYVIEEIYESISV